MDKILSEMQQAAMERIAMHVDKIKDDTINVNLALAKAVGDGVDVEGYQVVIASLDQIDDGCRKIRAAIPRS